MFLKQEVICRKLGKKVENTAVDTVLRNYGNATYVGETTLKENANILKSASSPNVKAMEDFNQGYGYIIYCTKLFVGAKGAMLLLPEIHDIAHIYVNGKYYKTLYRNGKEKKVLLPDAGETTLQIVVENMGRVNYGIRLEDRKGLIGDIELMDIEYNVYSKIFGYAVYSLELNDLPEIFEGKADKNTPAFYKYEFEADEAQDTLLCLKGFTRGVAFVNGINLGRHWTIEHTENKLFLPAPFLKKGKNSIIIFDILANDNTKSVELIGEC